MHYLFTLAKRYLAARILHRFTVRVHSGLARHRWAKLWYVLRGLDPDNSGHCQISITDIQELLTCKESTVYEWLREGEWAGAFRSWRVRRGVLEIYLGGLTKVSLQLGLQPPRKNWAPWGTTALVPLHQIKDFLKPLATAANTQRLQQDSHFAARIGLSAQERERFTVLPPQELFQKLQLNIETSDNPSIGNYFNTGAIPCLLHVGPRRLFTSKGFIPYGASQITIAETLNYRCDRTIRRHHQLLRLNKRQLVQSKAAYGSVRRMLEDENAVFDNGDFVAGEGVEQVAFCSLRFAYGAEEPQRHSTLFESNGRTSSRRHFSVDKSRFFRYMNKEWIYRCNLYEPSLKLCSMAERIYQHQNGQPSPKAHKAGLSTKKAAPACSKECSTVCATPLKSLHGCVFAGVSAESMSSTDRSSCHFGKELSPFSPLP